MNEGAAREKVRVSHALPRLPKISAAFRDGLVSYSKVRAMTRVAETWLAGDGDRSGGDRYLLNIHTEVETLEEQGEGADAELEGHGRVSAETSRRMACDASVIHWHETGEGETLNIGRKSRSIPPATRRVLQRRVLHAPGRASIAACTHTRSASSGMRPARLSASGMTRTVRP